MTGSESFGSPRSTANKSALKDARRMDERRLTDVLDHVISKGVLNKFQRMRRDFLNQLNLLDARCMVNASLKHAATVAMGSNRDAMFSNRIKDKLESPSSAFEKLLARESTHLSIFRLQPIQAFLDDVVPIEVLNELDNLAFEGVNNGFDLLAGRKELNHLLQCPGTVLVQSNVDQTRRRSVDKNGALFVVGEFKKLLTEIVSKRVFCRTVLTHKTREACLELNYQS